MEKNTKEVLVIFTIVGLFIAGMVLLVILCPECFPPPEPDKPVKPNTPTNYLLLTIDFDERGAWEAGEAIEIRFKKDNRFEFHDAYYDAEDDEDVFEGDFEYDKDDHGTGELELTFDTRRPEDFDIKLKDGGVFTGVRDDEDNGGRYRWLKSTPVPTNHLLFTIKSGYYLTEYNVIFQDDERFTYDEWSGDYYYEQNKYNVDDKVLILHYDGVGNCDWHLMFYNSTHFTMTKCPSYSYSGKYEWVV